MSAKVSVVVPTYRRNDLLTKCLACLRAQTLPSTEYEVIVADDGPSDATAALVAAWNRQPGAPIRYVPVTATQGPAGARNAGWRMASGAIVAFTDDDCLPEPEWLAAGVAACVEADAVTGRTIVPLPAEPTDFEQNTAGLATAEFITANCFVRKAVLEAVGGFDERYTLAWREDSDLHFALLSAGYQIVREARAVVVHPVRAASWGISLRQQRQGQFDPLLYKKYSALYRSRIAPLPRLYYVAVGALAVALAAGLSGATTISALALGVWLAATAWLTYQRLRATSRRWSHVVEMALTSAMIPLLSLYWRVRGALRYSAFYW